MRITSSRTGGIATMPDPVQIPAELPAQTVTEAQDLRDRLMDSRRRPRRPRLTRRSG